MKTIKAWLTTIAVLLCGITASAHDFEMGGIYYRITSSTEKTVAVTYKGNSYSSSSGEYSGTVVIPSIVTRENITYSVSSIDDWAFYECSNLTSVVVPNSVALIGSSAFSQCYNLTSISLSEGITSIGSCAFECCGFTSVSLPNSITSIAEYAFMYCHNLTSLTIPANVNRIGENIFYYCSNLSNIVIDEGNRTYDSRGNCNAIIKTESNSLIAGCHTTIIPNTVTSIGDNALSYCNFTSMVLPDNLISIGNYAFSSCRNLISITIPNSVTSISTGAFNSCESLNSVILSNNLSSIGAAAFAGCSVLTSIILPGGIKKIGEGAFNNCENLSSIICEAVNPPIITAFPFPKVVESIPLYVPKTAISSYQSDIYWGKFTNILPLKKNLTLVDGEDFLQVEEEECASISYTRTFTNTNWQALYVPFEIPVTEEFLADFEVADLNDIRQYDRDDDGVKDETVVEAFKVKSGALAANYPYLIRAKVAGEKTITVTDATLFATEEVSIDCSSIREKFIFTGTYSRMESNELTGCYALSKGKWQPLVADATLGAFRVYLKIESRNGNKVPAQAIRIRVIGEDDVTAIDEMGSSANDQQPTVVYDLQGRRIMNVDDFKGVYIVNGKKVVK